MSLYPGRHLWSGYLADDNVEKVVAYFRDLLPIDQRYTFTTVNELFGFRPEIRHERVEKVDHDRIGQPLWDGKPSPFCGVTVVDTYGVGSIITRLATQPRYGDPVPPKFDSVRLDISDQQITAEHYAPAGHRLWWVWQVEPADWCRECGTRLALTCQSCSPHAAVAAS